MSGADDSSSSLMSEGRHSMYIPMHQIWSVARYGTRYAVLFTYMPNSSFVVSNIRISCQMSSELEEYLATLVDSFSRIGDVVPELRNQYMGILEARYLDTAAWSFDTGVFEKWGADPATKYSCYYGVRTPTHSCAPSLCDRSGRTIRQWGCSALCAIFLPAASSAGST